MRLYISIVSLVMSALFLGCVNKANDTDNDYAYFGGEIVNPQSDYIILTKDEKPIDTIMLDGRNRFMYKIDHVEEGLYSFYHGGELQMMMLEPMDSLLIRLNTMEFDESLVFSGIGAKRNNFLINDFLDNEKTKQRLYSYCQLSPDDYIAHIDSVKSAKLQKLNDFVSKYGASNMFKDFVKTNADYSYYSSKEIYPFLHRGKNKREILASLPANFYDFRKNIDYNDEKLKDHFLYRAFLRYSFNTEALQEHLSHTDKDSFGRTSLCYNMDKLKLIDSLVQNPKMKDDLLYYFTINYLTQCKNMGNNQKVLNYFLTKSHNPKNNHTLERFNASVQKLQVGNDFPNIALVNYNNNDVQINDVIKQPTVISFWSNDYFNHFRESHFKVRELQKKYPEINFIMINIDGLSNTEKSKLALKQNRFGYRNEYYLKDPKKSTEDLAVYPMTKTFLVNHNDKIVNNNTNIFSVHFEEQLLGLINQ